MKKSLIIVSVSLIMLSGCSDPKDATESNFKKATQEYLDSQYPHCYILINFPVRTDGFSFNNLPKILHVMAETGLLKETEISRKHIPASWASKARDVVVNSYDLTDEGKKYYKADASKNMRGEALGGFCFGKATVEAIDNFTEPSDTMGQKISRVSFSYKVTNIPDWANTPELLNLDRRLKEDVTSSSTPNKKSDVFILTGKGWMHEKLFGK